MSINISSSDMQAIQNMLSDVKNGAKKAVTKALNKTATTTKVQVKKRLGQEINLKASRIDQDLSIKKASYDNMSASVKAVGEPVGLINFAGKQLKQGVRVKVYKSGTSKVLKHAFIAKRGSKDHLFWRKYNGQRKPIKPNLAYGKLPKKYRQPVERLTGPRIEDVLAKDEILNAVNNDAGNLLAENLSKEVDEVLRRHRGGF